MKKNRPNRYKPVIYKICSNVNSNKIYIGSTIYLVSRKTRHLSDLKKNIHGNTILQNHVNKYGIDDIYFEIVEYVDLEENLILREQFYIDTLNPKFNVRKIADSNLGIKKSEEQKRKQSDNNPRYWKGKNHSEETKKKISCSKKGVKIHSEEHKGKMSERMNGNQYSKGSVRTDEFKNKVVAVHKNKYVSDETREKLREINLGRKMSDEAKLKMSNARKGKKLSKESIIKREATRAKNRLLNKLDKNHVEKAANNPQ